ncbi:MAG: flagellar assembly protein H [Rhizobiales bacterium]|nr:flagellar assembly protein H [Hyphomicrobiales bacterium]
MSKGQAVKFTFDTNFGSDMPKKASAAQMVDDASLEEARAKAYGEGFAAGEKEATNRADQDLRDAMETLASNAGSLLAALDATSATMRAEATEMAGLIARKLAPALIATRPQTEIEAVLRDCLSHLNREPHIILRVSPDLVDSMKDSVDQMAMERGLSGRIILLGEGSMAPGDCLVEWADGGVERDRKAIEADIDSMITRYINTIAPRREASSDLEMPEPHSKAAQR